MALAQSRTTSPERLCAHGATHLCRAAQDSALRGSVGECNKANVPVQVLCSEPVEGRRLIREVIGQIGDDPSVSSFLSRRIRYGVTFMRSSGWTLEAKQRRAIRPDCGAAPPR